MVAQYREPEFSRSHVNRAGRILAGTEAPVENLSREKARRVVDNRRAAHAWPLLTLRMLLWNRARKVDPDALVAQRLKRLVSVEAKLRRFPTMSLARMQDLGGCRAILPSVAAVDALVERHRNGRQGHDLARSYDYIEAPRKSG